ncbi:MAG: hypothetical protein V3V06_01620 [Dehalococcoidia bacterium]
MSRGAELVKALKTHLLDTLQSMPECQADGEGARNKDIEGAADLALDLDEQDSYVTWSILQSLVRDGKIESVGEGRRRRYRLPRE